MHGSAKSLGSANISGKRTSGYERTAFSLIFWRRPFLKALIFENPRSPNGKFLTLKSFFFEMASSHFEDLTKCVVSYSIGRQPWRLPSPSDFANPCKTLKAKLNTGGSRGTCTTDQYWQGLRIPYLFRTVFLPLSSYFLYFSERVKNAFSRCHELKRSKF